MESFREEINKNKEILEEEVVKEEITDGVEKHFIGLLRKGKEEFEIALEEFKLCNNKLDACRNYVVTVKEDLARIRELKEEKKFNDKKEIK